MVDFFRGFFSLSGGLLSFFGLLGSSVDFRFRFHLFYLISIICPTAEFHVAMLIVKWKPRDVNFACAFEYSRRHIQTTAITFNNDIRVVGSIESFVSTDKREKEKENELFFWANVKHGIIMHFDHLVRK